MPVPAGGAGRRSGWAWAYRGPVGAASGRPQAEGQLLRGRARGRAACTPARRAPGSPVATHTIRRRMWSSGSSCAEGVGMLMVGGARAAARLARPARTLGQQAAGGAGSAARQAARTAQRQALSPHHDGARGSCHLQHIARLAVAEVVGAHAAPLLALRVCGAGRRPGRARRGTRVELVHLTAGAAQPDPGPMKRMQQRGWRQRGPRRPAERRCTQVGAAPRRTPPPITAAHPSTPRARRRACRCGRRGRRRSGRRRSSRGAPSPAPPCPCC